MLEEKYEVTKPMKKKPFTIDGITDLLMENGIEIDNIIHTPKTVVVKLPREEYISKGIGNIVARTYKVTPVCKDDMLVFHNPEE